MGGFPFLRIMLAFVLFGVLTIGIGFLFAATADTTGFVSLLPLLAVFAVLILGTVLLARRALK